MNALVSRTIFTNISSSSSVKIFAIPLKTYRAMAVNSQGLPLKTLSLLFVFLLLRSSIACASEPQLILGVEDKQVMEDQVREQQCKEACDFNSPQRVSEDIIPHILNLYGSCATAHDFKIYAPNATFEDPLMRAHGVKQIKSAFYSIPKVFSESKIVEYNIKENVISPSQREILIDNKQHYKFMGKGIDMISLIKLYVEGGKVVRHEDWWDKKPLWNRDTVKVPLVGRIMEITRRGSMLTTHTFMRFGKDPTPAGGNSASS